jgi:uncharacterized OB-fold protein
MTTALKLPEDLAAMPMPDIDGEWKPFWEGTERRELLIQECTACRARQFYPRAICVACGGEPAWLKASGRGSIYTFTVTRQNLVPPFRAMTPYVLAMIDLDEGVRMMANVIDCDLEDVAIGQRVEVRFVPVQAGFTVPYWTLASSA